MRKSLAERSKVNPKRMIATMLAFVQLFLLFPVAAPMGVMAAGGNVEYTRINPEVAIYNAQTGIDEKLYEREISADSKFNAATKSSLFNLSFVNNLAGTQVSFKIDDKIIGLLRRKDNNLQTSASASFHNYKHQHTWKSGLFGLKKNTANVTTACVMSYNYRVSGYYSSPNLAINSRDMAKDYERLSTGYSPIFSYDSNFGNVVFAASLQGTMFDGGNRSCACPGYASITKPVISFMDNNAPSIVSITGIDNKILKAGETVNIEVKFDEPIRFADDSAAHDDLYVNLAISGISSDRYPKAMLKKLDIDTLYFSYTVPSNDNNLEQTITGVDFSPLMKECDLVVVFEDESFELSTSGLNNSNNIGYTRATSYITDIAGNGMRESDRMYNVTETYIDTKAPTLTKISTAVNANNTKIKEMLGSTDTDNSDIYLGMGDSISYGLTFSEVLNIAEGEYAGITATTNIVDKNGNPVTLTSKTLSKIPTDDNAYGLGPSKGNVTYIDFDTLTIEEGMTCSDADGIIRIISVSFSETVNDYANNTLTVSDEEARAANKTTVYLDVNMPEIVTSLTATNDVYAAVPYADGSGFYFPFEITDSLSGINGLEGTFVWNKGEDSVYGSLYSYAVTSSADVPAEWKIGYMNRRNSFTQVEGTQYLHIKKYAGITYELLDTSLGFTATDYAGNEYSVSSPVIFKINTIWDNTYPFAKLGEVTKELNGASGTLTVNVDLTESTALKDAYYLWTDTAAEPSLDEINQAFPDIEGKTSVTVTITENIANGEDFNKHLWIKVSDLNGNEMLYYLGRQRYNLETIEYFVDNNDDYSKYFDFTVRTNNPDGYLVALLPVPNEPDYYYISFENWIRASYYCDLADWYKVYSADRRNFEYVDKSAEDDEYLEFIFNGYYSEKYGYRNGDYTIYVISGVKEAFDLSPDTDNPLSAGNASHEVGEEVYNVRVIAREQEGYDFYPERSVTTKENIPESSPYEYYYYTDDMAISTLAGLTFDIDLGEDTSGWEYDPIDLDASYILVSSNSGYRVQYKLNRQQYQSITLPEDDYPTGIYTVALALYLKNTSTPLPSIASQRIYVDSRTAPDVESFGIDRLVMLSEESLYETGITEQIVYPHEDTIYMPTSNNTNGIPYSGVRDRLGLYGTGAISWGTTETGVYCNTNLLMWNVSAGQTEDLATVSTFSTQLKNIELTDKAGADEYVANINREDPGDSGNAPLVLIKDQINVIAVRAALSNGEKSEIKYYNVYPSWLEVSGSFTTEKNDDNTPVVLEDNTLIFTPAEGQSMEGIQIFARGNEGKIELLPQPDGTYRCDAEPGFSMPYYHAVNQFGSVCYFGEYFGVYRDEDAPVITYLSDEHSDGEYRVNLRITDMSLYNYLFKSPIDLKLTFDEEYSKRLGYEEGIQTTFEIAIDEFSDYSVGQITPEDDYEFVWNADDISPTGIYRVEAIIPKNSRDGYMDVTIYGTARYIPEEETDAPVTFDMTVEATDIFGRTGSVELENITATNTMPFVVNNGSIKPEYKSKESNVSDIDYALALPFNVPVQPEKSWILPDPEGYQKEWIDGFPVTRDGISEISFYDIFGTLYTQEIELVDVFGEYGLELTISPETYTKDFVSVTASMTDENTEKAFVFYEVYDNGSVKHGILGSDGSWLPAKSRTIQRDNNNLIAIYVYPRAYTSGELNTGFTRYSADILIIHIDNMANEAPVAQPLFYFDQYGEEYTEEELFEKFPDGIETTGDVEVYYKTSRYVRPIDGTEEKVRFTYQDTDTSYMFKYVDDFGNEGSLEIDLADYGITFAAPPEPYKDEAAPTLVVDVYAKLFNNYTAMGTFSKDTAPDDVKQEFENIGYVQGYSMKIGVTDYSSYKIVVLNSAPTSLDYNSAVSDIVSGVSISGNTITISKDIASDFTVAVVDNAAAETAAENDNFSYVTIKAQDLKAWFDTTKPVSEQQIVQNGLYEQIAYVKFTDKADDGTEIDPSTVTILNGVLEMETEGEYAGWYKRVFTDNASYEILFQDHVGNLGEKVTLESSGIDTAPPALKITWTPPYVSADGQIDAERYTAKTVNTSVYAHIASDKAIDVENVRLTHYTYDNLNWTELENENIGDISECYASYTVNTEGITVCFEQGGIGLRFEVPSPNGRSTTADVYLPAETIDKAVPNVQTEKTEHKRDGFDVPYAVTLKMTPDKSVYCSNYGRADKVYDSLTPLEVTITQNGTYEYVFVDKAGNRKTALFTVNNIDNSAPELTFDPEPSELPVINTEQKITVTADEACTLTFDGNDYSLNANGSKELTFSKNGVYTVIATDAAGNESIVNIPVGNMDTTPPDISFATGTIRICQDSDEEVLAEELSKGVTAWEPETQQVIEDWSYDAGEVDLTTVGIYKVIYTAKDDAGNTKTAVRYVSVYDKNNPGIYIDGIFIEAEGTTIIKAGEHEITVDNIAEIAPGVLEPYTIKISKGISSIGQMKFKRADVLIGSDGKFTITPGFYTVSVTTQSRKTFRAILYVEK